MSSRQVARILSKHRNRHKEEEEEEVRVGYCPQCETIVSLPCVMCRVKLFESHITHRDTVYTDFPLSVEIIGLKPASKLLEKLTLVGIKQVGHILEETVDSLIDHVSLKFFEVEFLLKRLEKLGLNVEKAKAAFVTRVINSDRSKKDKNKLVNSVKPTVKVTVEK